MSDLLEPDKTWAIFDNFSPDRNHFAKTFLPELYLKPAVHRDIRDNFEVIQKLLEHSYFVYKFYDVAVLRSLLTLEMALRIQNKKKTAEDWGKKSLNSLMKWFEQKNHFEVYNKDFLSHVRGIRNLLAHSVQHTISGATGRPVIENVVDVINGLYENPALRWNRMRLTGQIITQIHKYSKGIKCTLNDKSYFAISAWPAFINNKEKPKEIHFYFHPTFIVPETTAIG